MWWGSYEDCRCPRCCSPTPPPPLVVASAAPRERWRRRSYSMFLPPGSWRFFQFPPHRRPYPYPFSRRPIDRALPPHDRDRQRPSATTPSSPSRQRPRTVFIHVQAGTYSARVPPSPRPLPHQRNPPNLRRRRRPFNQMRRIGETIVSTADKTWSTSMMAL